jgi:hypothetical protein
MATTAKRYGLPYKGSKNSIAPWVIDHLPPATTLYDLFCGGCAITHAALLSGKWRKVVANDIDGDMPRFFLHCANGGMRGENRWISREDFFRLKDTDPYVRLCWSFGNNQKCYLYSKEIEPWKKALHYARLFGDTEQLKEMGIKSEGSTVDVQQHHEEYKMRYIKWYLQREGEGNEKLYKAMDEFAEIADKRRDELIDYIRDAIESAGMTVGGIADALNKPVITHYMMKSEWAFPHKDVYERMQRILPKLTIPYDDLHKRVLFSEWHGCESRCVEGIREVERLQHIQRLLRIGKMQNITRLERLQELERGQRLNEVETFDSLSVSSQSYDEAPIPDPENSVIYCFDKDTEILTEDGWKNVADVKIGEKCLSREPNTGRLEYVPTVNTISYHHEGMMYHYCGKNVDVKVTLNHRMFLRARTGRDGKTSDVFMTAAQLLNAPCDKSFLSAGGVWHGDDAETVEICGETFDKLTFAYLLGVFLTDGSVNKIGIITISQAKAHIIKKIKNALERLGMKHSIYEKTGDRTALTFYISRKYYPYFRQFYLKKNRRIPKDVKAWGAKYLHALIEGVLDGDGSENRRVYCGARGLMDDVQEVCYKIGLSANIAKCEPHESYYQKENRIIKAHKPYYCLSINHRPLLSVIRRNQRLVPYNDMVNCVTLEKWHTVLVRRNGKSVWCGQCDPPYFSTEQKQYRKLGEEGFDSLKFYDWCERQKALTIISEYDMPRDRFTCVAEVTKTSLASGTGAIQCVERLFTPNHQAEEYRHRMGRLF